MTTLRTCKLNECKKPFTPTKPWQRFCDHHCRTTFHNRIKQRLLKHCKKLGIT